MLGTKGSVRNGGWWDTQADERAQVASMGVANGQGAQQDNAQHNFLCFLNFCVVKFRFPMVPIEWFHDGFP
jgi:hypothetical protein